MKGTISPESKSPALCWKESGGVWLWGVEPTGVVWCGAQILPVGSFETLFPSSVPQSRLKFLAPPSSPPFQVLNHTNFSSQQNSGFNCPWQKSKLSLVNLFSTIQNYFDEYWSLLSINASPIMELFTKISF